VCELSEAVPKEAAGAPDASELEIEVTPEMIEAGFAILRGSCIADDLLEADRGTVVEIYRAMHRYAVP
jgi:hypothetical protein